MAAIAAFLALSVPHLDSYPPVGEDEPWIAAAPAKLARDGVLGNDLFTGYYGMERHHLQHMPVYPVLEAAVFELFGVGVRQMRLLSVLFGAALLAVVFAAGARAGGVRLGAAAVACLLLVRIAAPDHGTGILLLDRARINRYDIAVPVFGLLALLALDRALARGRGAWFAAAGVLAALSSLSHLYGIFWLVVLIALLAAMRLRQPSPFWKPAGLVIAGFAAAWTPWALVLAWHWTDYLGQMRPAGARFALLDPRFYAGNIVTGDGPISIAWAIRSLGDLPAARIGGWLTAAGLVAAAALAVRDAARGRLRDREAALLLAAALQLVLFMSLLAVKTTAYMIALWPLGALALAWAAIRVWDGARPALRLTMAAILALAALEGVAAIAGAERAARRVSPYAFYTGQIAGCIPEDARVLGLQHYWLGLRQFEYRTWLLPINLSRPGWYHERLTLGQALARVDPDVVLIDRYIEALLQETRVETHPNHQFAVDVERFLADRNATLACAVRDPTYGTMLVYVLETTPRRP